MSGPALVWAGIIGWALMWLGVHAGSPTRSWHWFTTGVGVFASGRGLQLYALHPELQIGPLSFAVAAPFAALPLASQHLVVAVAGMAAGLGLLEVLRRASGAPWVIFAAAAAAFIPVWAELAARTGHIDDIIALAATVAAVVLVGRWPVAAGAALAVAVDAKPWALAFVPLLLAAPLRQRWAALAVAAAGIVAVWAPFLAAPGALAAVRFKIFISATSTLHALGVADVGTPPWCRPVQLGVGAGLVAALVVSRRDFAGALLAAVAVRIALDPSTATYYDAGLALAAVAVDCTRGRTFPFPWYTLATLSLILAPTFVHAGVLEADVVHGWLRLAVLAGMVIAVCCDRPRRWQRAPLRPGELASPMWVAPVPS